MAATGWSPIWTAEGASLEDHRRHPGCRVRLSCALCGWSKGYDPERVLRRLQQLRVGRQPPTLTEVARRVAWNCPCCGNVKWRADLAWPPGLDAREIKRLANLHRS